MASLDHERLRVRGRNLVLEANENDMTNHVQENTALGLTPVARVVSRRTGKDGGDVLGESRSECLDCSAMDLRHP